MQMKYISHTSAKPPSLLRKTAVIVATTALAAVALMFSAMLLAFLLCVGAVAFTWLWWKTRALRRQMREQMKDFPPRGKDMGNGEVSGGEVIEGESIRVDEPADNPK